MRALVMAVMLAAGLAPLLPAQAQWSDRDKQERAQQRHEKKDYKREHREAQRDWRHEQKRGREDWHEASRYDWNRPDARYGGYRPERYYRDGRFYTDNRYLGRNDRIYRGGNGRYYCRRDDGTTGLIVGAIGGGVLGNAIAPGGSETIATLLGAGLGAALGRAVDNNGIRCR